MSNVELVNTILKFSAMNICIYFIFAKIINYQYSKIDKIFGIIMSIILSLIYYFIKLYMDSIISLIITYFIFNMIIICVTKNKIYYSIILTSISVTISFTVFMLSLVVAGAIVWLVNSNSTVDNIIIYILTGIIQLIVIYLILKIKRLKNGITFLQKDKNKIKVDLAGIILCLVVLFIYLVSRDSENVKFNTYAVCGVVILAISLAKWIQNKITLDFKNKMQQKTIEEQDNIIKEKDEEILRLSNDLFKSAKIIHEYKHRISAMENNLNMETAGEITNTLDEIKKLSKDLVNDVEKNKSYDVKLPTTNVLGIDNILNYMYKEANENNIEFNLKINASINYMIETVITQGRLETLIGDFIKNSIIAVKLSNNTYKAILVMLGVIEDCYSICVYDSGIEFEIDTLLNLGLIPFSTHLSDGGSGIGFITTFELLKEYNASLIIEEKKVNKVGYTKSLTVRFDKEGQYIIKSYRAEEIRNKAKDNRIIIEDL